MFGVCSYCNIPVGSETRPCLVFAHIAIYQWGQEHEHVWCFAHIAIHQWGQEHEQVSNLSVSIETNHVEDSHISTGEGSVI